MQSFIVMIKETSNTWGYSSPQLYGMEGAFAYTHNITVTVSFLPVAGSCFHFKSSKTLLCTAYQDRTVDKHG